MQRSSIIITYLILWTKFGLNGARMMNFEFWGRIFVFCRSWKWGLMCCCVADNWLKSRCVT